MKKRCYICNEIFEKSKYAKTQKMCCACRERKCPYCNEIFTIRLNSPTQRYCSVRCSNLHRCHKTYQGKSRNIFCKSCGQAITTKLSNKRRKFCNKNCYSLFLQQSQIGSRNPNWRGGVQPLRQQVYHTQESIKWKRAVLLRDNYMCQMCGSIKQLHAHHIKSFVEFKELRCEINNGITLCKTCHYSSGLHKKQSGRTIPRTEIYITALSNEREKESQQMLLQECNT